MRQGNKLYWKIPGGGIQFGLISRCLIVWFRRKCYILKHPNQMRIDYHFNKLYGPIKRK